MMRYLFVVPDPACAGGSAVVRRRRSAASSCSSSRARARSAGWSWWIPSLWVALACVSIAINGSRDLPQYFLQAAPALALAAGWRRRSRSRSCRAVARGSSCSLLAVATWRVGDDPFPKLAAQRLARHAVRARPDRSPRRTWRVRRGARRRQVLGARQPGPRRVPRVADGAGRDGLRVRLLAGRVRLRRPAERLALLLEPAGDPRLQRRAIRRYGVAGPARGSRARAARLRRAAGARLVPDVQDSAPFFLSQPPLADWLRADYHRCRPVHRRLRGVGAERPMTNRGGSRGAALTAIVLAGDRRCAALFPAADPPWRSTVGVVWHDEGAWVHNARNKALFGDWRQDEWNPVFIAPVFTALEYASFAAFGVGVRQARLVSEVAGVLVGAPARARRPPRSPAIARGPDRRRAARDQLRLRHVQPRRDHGGADGRLHRRVVVLLDARGADRRGGARSRA